MPFLSRRPVDPSTSTQLLRDKSSPFSLSRNPRSRARSEASLLRRVSTLFTARRRSTAKASASQLNASRAGIEYRCSRPWSSLPRVSSDSTPQSSLEIRRPSGLGRRASIIDSNESADSESIGGVVTSEEADAAPTGFSSLPNLLGGAVRSPEIVTYMPVKFPRKRRSAPSALPDPVFRVVLEFLPRNDLAVVALVSRWFCDTARHALYRSLDVRTVLEFSLEKLYDVLASRQELAALVVSFHCHSWPSWELAFPDGRISSVPSDHVRQALQNMCNLKNLTLASFASIVSHMPSFTFSLTRLTILDKRMTQSQLVAMRGWLATQPSLESLSFPHLVECTSTDPSFVDEWATIADPSQTDGHGPFSTILPGLKSLRASTEIVSTLCCAMHNPIERLTLDVHETLYTGLRPSTVIRSLGGVRDMHIVFGPEVDKRTVEKFLAMTGSMLTADDKAEAMKSLEIEVSWTDEDAAETLYGIVTSIISRFRGLEVLKLTSPFRSIQPPILGALNPSLLRPSTPASPAWTASSSTPPSDFAPTPRHSWVRKEFVACGVEKDYAKTWTKNCPSLSDIQFDFSCSTTDADLELCGVWFRRKMPLSLPSTT